jgi:hypothetical protein
VDCLALEARVAWAGTFAPEAPGVLAQEVTVRAAVTRAVRVSVEDAVVRVASDVSGQAEERVRCIVFRVVAAA